jgi:hypothetical protein
MPSLVKIDHIATWMGGSDKSHTAELIDAKKRNPGQGITRRAAAGIDASSGPMQMTHPRH